MIAVIKTGGKQYVVHQGDKIKVEKLDKKEGEVVTFLEVLLVAENPSTGSGQGQKVEVGNPILKKASVLAKIISHGKAEKVISFKYKPKKRYARKVGHRQPFTEIEITEIKS